MNVFIDELMERLDQKTLIIMPVTRLLFNESFIIGDFHFFPAGVLNLNIFKPIKNKTLENIRKGQEIIQVEGQVLREVSTSLTGFDLDALSNSPLIAFMVDINWEKFREADHNYDVSLLELLSAKAERALNIIRLYYCRLDLPDTLPGQVGSWIGSDQYLGALLYSPQADESRLIAGAAVEVSMIVRGLGLEIDHDPHLWLPDPSDGEVAGIFLHGLSLYSEALSAPNQTIKFMRIMSLLEFLASPDEYKRWGKIKGNILCFCATNKTEYIRLCEKFSELISITDTESGNQVGLRTLIVHNGKLLPELISSSEKRASLFRRLQRYAFTVLHNMLLQAHLSWSEYVEYRNNVKRILH